MSSGQSITVKFNPFRPGGIVTTGMFAGRYNEIVALEKVLHQTKNGNPLHFMVSGERGIGKSSLLYYLTILARGEINPLDMAFNFLVVSIELQPSTT